MNHVYIYHRHVVLKCIENAYNFSTPHLITFDLLKLDKQIQQGYTHYLQMHLELCRTFRFPISEDQYKHEY